MNNEIVNLITVNPHKTLWIEAHGQEHQRVILYKEDKVAIEKAGYDISSWRSPEPKMPVPIEVVLIEKHGTRRVAAVKSLQETEKWIDVKRKRRV